ncbi:MAG TPA: heat-inducible transcriptional repressor HrcA [Steroidobacteraceae bacterium]|jgi:heat-inducible transcriptional repressor|nr:heat-inducible transcriptional repressor HrcA [Steroidobacteraceae bacterium]
MSPDLRDDPLNDRAQRLLRILVESYIRDGQPVGSRSLSRESGLNLSSATVRNVMADLEQLGFVASPHTSAGRVPTDKGYRFFVDTLLRVQPMDPDSVSEIRRQLDGGHDSKVLVATASQLLSSITQLAGVVTLPSAQQSSITHIEFVPLSENRVLAVLVLNNSEVQNRIIQLERSFQLEELRRAANFLNTHFVGRSPSEVRQEILRQMRETRERMNQIMLDAITMAQQLFNVGDPAQEKMDYVIAGETNLMGVGELSSVEKLKRLFEAFNERRDFLHLLDHSLKAQGVQIFIGHESGYQVLDDYSLVTAPYSLGDQVVGVLGVIGPMRMAYERVIPIVDVTAKLLGAALNSKRSPSGIG